MDSGVYRTELRANWEQEGNSTQFIVLWQASVGQKVFGVTPSASFGMSMSISSPSPEVYSQFRWSDAD